MLKGSGENTVRTETCLIPPPSPINSPVLFPACCIQNAGSAEPWSGYRHHSVWADCGQSWLPHPRGLLPGLPLHRSHCR